MADRETAKFIPSGLEPQPDPEKIFVPKESGAFEHNAQRILFRDGQAVAIVGTSSVSATLGALAELTAAITGPSTLTGSLTADGNMSVDLGGSTSAEAFLGADREGFGAVPLGTSLGGGRAG